MGFYIWKRIRRIYALLIRLHPGLDGLGLCRKIRTNSHTANLPVLLTGQNVHYSVTSALEAGGDDYIAKPFALRELAARMRAHLRRVSGNLNDAMPMLRILPETQTIYINDREVILTQVEFELISFLCRKPNQLHRTEDLLTGVWQYPRGSRGCRAGQKPCAEFAAQD